MRIYDNFEILRIQSIWKILDFLRFLEFKRFDVWNYGFLNSKQNDASLKARKFTVFKWQSFKVVEYDN